MLYRIVFFAAFLLATLAGSRPAGAANALPASPAVVVSIAPLHSLVAGVMDGVGAPHLLVPGNASEHAYALRPSDSRRLAEARAVFWIGESLENFLERPLASLAARARVVEVIETPGLTRRAAREGGIWEAHEDRAAEAGKEPQEHDHKGIDGHIWLDPGNARVLVARIATVLADIDPANAARYRTNAKAMEARLSDLDARLHVLLRPIADKPYIVFHDAYQYFERRYGLSAVGAVTVSPGRAPGARRLMDLRARITTTKAACVFIEPQFEPRIARTVVEGTGAKIAVLDPLGARLAPGKDAYFTLMETLAANLVRCLQGP